MKSETISLIENMDGFRLLRFFNHFSTTLFDKVDADAETIIRHLPANVKNIPEMKTVMDNQEQYSMPLESEEAIKFARASLLQLAQEKNTAPALAEAIKNYKDDEQSAEVILAMGGVVSFIMLLATSKIKYETGKGWEVNVLGNREGIKDIIELIKTLFNAIPESILKLTSKQ
ncbi:hypothetical protein FC093_12870 [Ilyomonas limi]|uniref:Uncharacterized protein n=1 Tax=Ilyomonas limi TaxID=2575867 RepID=A0A4U3KY65_9BACT|nr:hypothetical protein [Ilyomonas limi]TKK67641.1 hypothetical protein FC093_12870 [Ilyomonas limi]